MRQIVIAALLALAALCASVAAVGVLRSRNNFAALHCAAAGSILAPVFAFAAVIVRVPAGQPTLQMLIVFLAIIAGGPISSHAIAVAEYRRRPKT